MEEIISINTQKNEATKILNSILPKKIGSWDFISDDIILYKLMTKNTSKPTKTIERKKGKTVRTREQLTVELLSLSNCGTHGCIVYV